MKRVLVTVSSRGIGRAIAERLAAQGFAVTVHCRQRREEAQAVARAIGASTVLAFDVRERGHQFRREARPEHGDRILVGDRDDERHDVVRAAAVLRHGVPEARLVVRAAGLPVTFHRDV